MNVTDATITVKITAIPGATSYNIAWHEEGAPASDRRTTSLSVTFTGLKPETTYYFNYYGVNSYGTGPYASTVSGMTAKKKPVIALWSWTSSNGSASAAQTRAAYTAVTNQGALSDFSYLVWNDLVDKVYEVIQAANITWETAGGKYISYGQARMSSSDKALTAARFNALKVNIGSRQSTGVQDVSPGDIVVGAYFVKLTGALNTWISRL